MTNYYMHPQRSYISITKKIQVAQQTRTDRETNIVETRFNMLNLTTKQKFSTDWIRLPVEEGTFVDVLVKQMPVLSQNLPLIETTYNKMVGNRRMSQKLCSSFLLRDGTLAKRYMPITDSINTFLVAYHNHNDRIPLNTGGRVIMPHATEIVAIIVE